MSDPAGDDSDIVEYLLDVSWRCLNAPKAVVDSRFSKVASTRLELSFLFLSLGLKFCYGLLNVLQAANPPSFEWFEALPTDIPKKSWGIYVLILQKDGHRPALYIGSGTEKNGGVKTRIFGYFRQPYPASPSQHTRKYLEEGYSIIQCNLLVWCPIPCPGEIPRLRTTVVIIEAAFACIFWAMYNSEKSYGGLDSVCPWHRDSFEWDGLCSHSPLIEGFRSGERGLDCSPEELERIAARRRDRNRRRDRDLYRIKFSKGFWWRKYYSQEHRDRVKYLANRKYQQTYRQKHFAHKTYHRQKHIAYKRHYCPTCDVSFYYMSLLRKHKRTQKHLRKTTQPGSVEESHIQPLPGKVFSCEPCEKFFPHISLLRIHKMTQKHLRIAVQLGIMEEFHIQSLPGKVFSCEPCGKFFLNKSRLRVHMKTKKHIRLQQSMIQTGDTVENGHIAETEDKQYKCDACNFSSFFLPNFKTHEKTLKHCINTSCQ